ncbi:Very-long-chain 3-oxoacyl-CoA reductase-like protein [Citrus sinensis]|nr:Very-long-chain 3-oxoacyl-CoA reductase-like protein [Citrus sinensis]
MSPIINFINQLITISRRQQQQPWLVVLPVSALGFIILLKHSMSLLKCIYITFLRQPKNLKSYGSWALITGATDGIGKAFAHQLAQHGLNLILVSRNHNKLEKISNEIQAENPNTQINIVEYDFSCDVVSAGNIKAIEMAIDGLEVGVLINNVGITYPKAMFFHEVDEKEWMDIVRVNLEGTTRVTKAVLTGMMRRKKGAIVNIGSGAAIVVPSHPLFAIYAATKAYIDQLSRSLYVEYQRFGIDVQCQGSSHDFDRARAHLKLKMTRMRNRTCGKFSFGKLCCGSPQTPNGSLPHAQSCSL